MIADLRAAGLRVPPQAMLRMGVGGELAEPWARAAQRVEPAPPSLVVAAWEEVGVNLADVTKMAKILSAAQAIPPRTFEGLAQLVRSASPP